MAPAENQSDRQRHRPDYLTISITEARFYGYVSITEWYSIRQYDQCAMLDHVIADLAGCNVRLVRNSEGNQISVWRKKS
jgi:hypothetical protein